MGSKRYSLDTTDWKKVGIGLLMALSGVALEQVTEVILDTDFGQWTGVVVAGYSVLANAARKWIKDNA